jgi:hypothetical protein
MKTLVRCGVLISTVALGLGLAGGPAWAKPAGKAKAPTIEILLSPDPAIETATSDIAVVIEVEAKGPASPGDEVTISSTELFGDCVGLDLANLLGATDVAFPDPTNETDTGTISVALDNDGNATVVALGEDCAPGEALIEASEDEVPFHTATNRLVIESPAVTAPAVRGYPADEVETGDGAGAAGVEGTSDVYAVFYVEAPPVYAEDTESISSDELTARCGAGSVWSDAGGILAGAPGSAVGLVAGSSAGSADPADGTPIDDDGNVTYLFMGASCAAGTSTVVAAVTDGPTYRTTYKILPPAVTI